MPYVLIYTAISPDDRYSDRTSRNQGPYQWKFFAIKFLRIGYPFFPINIYNVENKNIIIREAIPADKIYSEIITLEMESSAKARGTGIAKRSPEYISQKIDEGKAVIAVTDDGKWVGFCYIETWEGEYVANSGLIVAPDFRKSGVAKSIKKRIF